MTSPRDFSSFQVGIRRYEATLNGIPDRVPLCAQLHEFAMQEIGAGAKEFYTNAELLVTATLEIHEKCGIDVPNIDYDVYNIEAEAIGQAMKYGETDIPDVDRTRPLIRDRDDLKKIRIKSGMTKEQNIQFRQWRHSLERGSPVIVCWWHWIPAPPPICAGAAFRRA